MAKLTFLGAAGEVTGSSYLVETEGAEPVRFLIDHGMFQGGREADLKNRRALPVAPRGIDFVLLSHAHIDHSGLLPRLVALGFRGPAYATRATCELLGVMLPDSGYLQEKDAEREARRAYRKRGKGRFEPLYTVQQARDCLRRLRPAEYDDMIQVHPSVRCRFRDAGHILGSSLLEIWIREGGAGGEGGAPSRETKLVFTGDLGQPGHPIVRNPTPITTADVLLIESTYGNRDHKSMAQTLDEFAFALNDTLASRRGNVVIPSFAVGRTQDILLFIYKLHRDGRIGPVDVYVDSPMATAATMLTLKHPELQNAESQQMARWLQEGASGGPRIHFTEDVEDSKRINEIESGAVIISASGMCDGGRIRHHLQYNLSRPECAIVFAGFQAAGTLGRRIVDGAKTVKIFGEAHAVRAKVFTIGGLSAHADRTALLDWLGNFSIPPRACYVVHGEPLAASALGEAINAKPGWHATLARPGESVVLDS